MANSIKTFLDQTNKQPGWYKTRNGKSIYGTILGEPMSVTVNDSNEVFIRIHGKTENENDPINQDDLDAIDAQTPSEYPMALVYGTQDTVRIKGVNSSALPTPALASARSNSIAYLASQKGYVPACDRCSDTSKTSHFVGEAANVHYLCDECMPTVSYEIAEMEREDAKGSYLMGLVGALLGALVGSVPMALLTYAGYASAYAGVLISMGAYYGYRFFKGPKNKPYRTIFTVCGVSAIGAVFAILTSIVVELIHENYSHPIRLLVQAMMYRTGDFLSLMGEFWQCFLFAALGLGYSVYKMLDDM